MNAPAPLTENDLEVPSYVYRGQAVWITHTRPDGRYWVRAVVQEAFGDAAYCYKLNETECKLIMLWDIRKLKEQSENSMEGWRDDLPAM